MKLVFPNLLYKEKAVQFINEFYEYKSDIIYYTYDSDSESYVEYKGTDYPKQTILYRLADKSHGYYHVRFDREGNLELS